MAGSYSRRSALCGLGFLSAGVVVAGSLMGARQSWALSLEQLPQKGKLLTREVERDLKDGSKLTVRRSWAISFEDRGRGGAIFGQQRAVEVAAPERLEPLAQIERERSTEGMFPILLDENGMILSAGRSYYAEDMELAIEEAEDLLKVEAMPTDQAETVHDTLMEIGRASAKLIETLPADLFFPRQPVFESRKPLSLPGGQKGEFVLRYETEVDPTTQLMRRAEREITTIIGSQKRFSREVWTLS